MEAKVNRIYKVENSKYKSIYIGKEFLFLHSQLETDTDKFDKFYENKDILDGSERIRFKNISKIIIQNNRMEVTEYLEQEQNDSRLDTIDFETIEDALDFAERLKGKVPNQILSISQKETKLTPMNSLFTGLAIVALGLYLFYQFNKLESEGGSMKINWIIALIYNLTGKWPITVLLISAGLVSMVKSAKKIILNNKSINA